MTLLLSRRPTVSCDSPSAVDLGIQPTFISPRCAASPGCPGALCTHLSFASAPMDRAAPPVPPSGVFLPSTLDEAKISRFPATAYYIPNFITEEEEAFILDKVCSPPTTYLLPRVRAVGVLTNAHRSRAPLSHAGSSFCTDASRRGHPTLYRTDCSMLLSLPGWMSLLSRDSSPSLCQQTRCRLTSLHRAHTTVPTMY